MSSSVNEVDQTKGFKCILIRSFILYKNLPDITVCQRDVVSLLEIYD